MNKLLVRLINEEISDFDFLNNDAYIEEKKYIDLLKNEDFQKQFICDSILNRQKIKKNVIDAQISDDDPNSLSLEYYLDITYKYDTLKPEIKFTIDFSGNKVNTEADDDNYTYINWSEFEVNMWTKDGDEVIFKALKNAPTAIADIFKREYIEELIDESANPSTTYLKKQNFRNIPYC